MCPHLVVVVVVTLTLEASLLAAIAALLAAVAALLAAVSALLPLEVPAAIVGVPVVAHVLCSSTDPVCPSPIDEDSPPSHLDSFIMQLPSRHNYDADKTNDSMQVGQTATRTQAYYIVSETSTQCEGERAVPRDGIGGGGRPCISCSRFFFS